MLFLNVYQLFSFSFFNFRACFKASLPFLKLLFLASKNEWSSAPPFPISFGSGFDSKEKVNCIVKSKKIIVKHIIFSLTDYTLNINTLSPFFLLSQLLIDQILWLQFIKTTNLSFARSNLFVETYNSPRYSLIPICLGSIAKPCK